MPVVRRWGCFNGAAVFTAEMAVRSRRLEDHARLASTGPGSPRRWLREPRWTCRAQAASTGPRSPPRRLLDVLGRGFITDLLQRGRGLHRGDCSAWKPPGRTAPALQRGRGLHGGDGCQDLNVPTDLYALQRGRGLHRGDGFPVPGGPRRGLHASTGPRSSPRRWGVESIPPPPRSPLQRGRGLHRGDGSTAWGARFSTTMLQRGRGLHRGDGES